MGRVRGAGLGHAARRRRADPHRAQRQGACPRPILEPAYRQAWSRLQEQLAAKYDSRPLIREVSITSCMSFTAEPFYLPSEPTVANPLRAAGYTDAAHRQCLAHAIADYAPWKASRLVLSLNPFYGLTRRTGDVGFTEQVM